MTSHSTRVIKVGGRAQADPALAAAIANAWHPVDRPFVVVHGGGDEVTALQQALGASTQFVGGRRVTSAQDVEVVRMALSGSANKRLVATLTTQGVRALGLSGEDGSLLTASPIDEERLGHVGAPHRANVDLLWLLLDAGYLPVISPISRNACAGVPTGAALGPALNVNGDDAAASIAVAIGARELLLVADVAGVFSDGAVIPLLSAANAGALIERGTAAGGMRAKLEAALAAYRGGVERVRIGDIAAIADGGRGTLLVD